MNSQNDLNNIGVLSDFQYSINLEYDLKSEKKIKNYIPTSSAIEIIEDVMLNTVPNATDRSRIFVGAYGKGKSHLALMILSLLCNKNKDLYSNLLSIICQTKPELCTLISHYVNSDQKMLPVIIQGSSVGLRQSFLQGLRKALERNQLENLMPDTYFLTAVERITEWKNEFPKVYDEFKKNINISVDDFIAGLVSYNSEYYKIFNEIYPKLTAGSEFIPNKGLDVVELYNDVNKKIKEYGYTGIFVVFDEFSKFLLGSAKKTGSDEIEILQYFAENCNRSGKNQMHIMLISHQSILSYVDKNQTEQVKIDSWKAVSERFKTVELKTTASQMYEMISHVINYRELWYKEFKEKNIDKYNNIRNRWKDKRIFSDVSTNEYDRVVYDCYPLHPVTTFILPRISEKVAQNERTLFTFLSASNQENTLLNFLHNHSSEKFEVVTPDYIYDYFEPLFKAEVYTSQIHQIWKSTTVALSKLKDNQDIERKIIKIISLINILDRMDLLSPSTSVVMNILENNYSSKNLTTALTDLTEQGIIRKLDNQNSLRIAEHTDVNIDELIKDKIFQRKTLFNLEDTLKSVIGNRAIYPNAYNDDNCITRYFDFNFIDEKKFLDSYNFKEKLNNTKADGIVYGVITTNENYKKVVDALKVFKIERVVFIVSKSDISINELCIKYDAIKNIVDINDDEILKSELSYTLNDIKESIDNYIDSFLRPELNQSSYFYMGKIKKVKRHSGISKLVSQICNDVFYNCPIINNEVINKNVVSTQAINSRNKVIRQLLLGNTQHNLGLNGSGQDVSFMRSTLVVKGLLVNGDNECKLNLENIQDKNLQSVITIIKNFVLSTSEKGKTSFSELYDILQNPNNHIGMRLGVIPVYLAVVLQKYKKCLVIYKDKNEIDISEGLLSAINDKPQDFQLYLEEWNNTKEKFIEDLEVLFNDFVRTEEKEKNNFAYIVHAMQRWYLQLPKYVKEISKVYLGSNERKKVNKKFIKYLNSLKNPEVNSRELLFNKIPKIFNIDGDYEELFEGSKEDKDTLYAIGLLISEAIPFAEKEKLVQSFEKEVPRVSEELDRIANIIGNGDYDIALSLAEKLIKEGEGYINDGTFKENSKMVFFSFEESMQEVLYRSLHRKERREIYAVPFPYATIYFMYGSVLWNLEEFEEAQTAFEKARKWNPVSASITLQYAETLSINGNISGKKCLKLFNEVFKYTFEPKELAYVYRTLGKFFSENELWKEAYICYNTSLKYDDNSGDAYNELEFIQDESGITENDISFGDEMKFTNNYGISLKPNQKIIKLAVDCGEEAYAEEDFEMAKYFLDIAYNLSPKAEIKNLLDEIKKELNS